MRITLLFLSIAISSFSYAQSCKKIDEKLIQQINTDISILASDSLEGRETGTKGELLALDYIMSRFEAMGLSDLESGGTYIQSFPFSRKVKIDKNTFLAIDGKHIDLGADFFPTKYSNALSSYQGEAVYAGFGIIAQDLGYNDYAELHEIENKALIIDVSSPDGIHPHSKYIKYHDLGSRIDFAINRGAAAVILVNQGEYAQDPDNEFKSLKEKSIPVVFTNAIGEMEIGDAVNISLKVKMREDGDLGHNAFAFIDNDAEKTIIIGAHYDHLGWGSEGSRYMGPALIHNGADDNASGTSALLSISEYLAARPKGTLKYNYIMIAFSGEEMGLLGSKYFADNMNVAAEKVLCMINFDMIGSLEEDGSGLIINGVGTSPVWKELLEKVKCKELSYTTTESGVGPSDQTSFYWKEIPALHFFTGSTTNYHKPSDDPEHINTKGLAQITQFNELLILKLNAIDEMEFTKTKEEEQGKRSRKFKVTLGVMPDYAYEGEGLKIDGVIEEKPAALAGIEGGDIVVQIGDIIISDMSAYMTALGAFEPGETVPVAVIRNGERIELEVTF